MSLGSRLLFVGQVLSPDDVIAAAIALPVIGRLRSRTHSTSRTPLLGIIGLALLVAGLAPFTFGGPVQPMHWMPFAELAGGRIDDLYFGSLERLFVGIGAVWVASGSALGLGLGTLALLGVTAAGEFAQRWNPARVPDSTDLVVMVLAALLVRVAQQAEGRRALSRL